MIGFTGARVIEQTIKKTLPEGFQESEFLLEHGQIDMVVTRKNFARNTGHGSWGTRCTSRRAREPASTLAPIRLDSAAANLPVIHTNIAEPADRNAGNNRQKAGPGEEESLGKRSEGEPSAKKVVKKKR